MHKIEFQLFPENQARLLNLCGELNKHIASIEKSIGVNISNRGFLFEITGDENKAIKAREIIENLYRETENTNINQEAVHLAVRDANATTQVNQNSNSDGENKLISIETKHGTITGRGDNQRRYLARIFHNAVNFGIGPAGTGKTYLAVAAAVGFLNSNKVSRIILVRPAVEAGERLGFLPGDMSQKVDPYLRPLYDALNDILGTEKVIKYVDRGTIEIAPLAFMRGRTLNDAFIILDEAQNTTVEQMKMFLTRLGFGSTAVITGDISQIDLPREKQSGLINAEKVLRNVEGISWTKFLSKDVVRHPLVQRIVDAYEGFDKNNFRSSAE
ncbi:MAG: PhoH family protein [Cardiobacteriaceae bacterium]|nr:PhoH family protein [Cardiobacteriaceae bacterium]